MNDVIKWLVAFGLLGMVSSCATTAGTRSSKQLSVEVPFHQDCPKVPESVNCGTHLRGFVCVYAGDEITWKPDDKSFRLKFKDKNGNDNKDDVCVKRSDDHKKCKLKAHNWGDVEALVFKYDILPDNTRCDVVDPYIILMK